MGWPASVCTCTVRKLESQYSLLGELAATQFLESGSPVSVSYEGDLEACGAHLPHAGAASGTASTPTVPPTTTTTTLPLAIPNLVGMNYYTAMTSLTGSGFPITITCNFTTSAPGGEVISQEPAAGTPFANYPTPRPTIAVIVSANGTSCPE